MSETNTTTKVETVEKNGFETPYICKVTANPIVFLAFAEYLGYTTPFIEWVDKICKGEDIPMYQKKVLNVEALKIYRMILECFKFEDIAKNWEKFYDVILKEYDENVNKVADDLPF